MVNVQSPEFLKYKGKIGEIRAKTIKENPELIRQGQSKGGKTTQERLKFKDILIKLLDEPTTFKKDGKEITMTRQEKLCMEALADNNKIKALEVIRDSIGEKPTDKIEMKAEITPEKATTFSQRILGLTKPADKADDE